MAALMHRKGMGRRYILHFKARWSISNRRRPKSEVKNERCKQTEEGASLPSQDTLTTHPDAFDSPQARVALGCFAEEVVEKVSGVEVAQHDCRMRTWSSWPANP